MPVPSLVNAYSVPIAACRVVRGSLAGFRGDRPFLTTVHRQDVGQSGHWGSAPQTAAMGLVSSRRSGSRLECPVGISGSFRNRPKQSASFDSCATCNPEACAVGGHEPNSRNQSQCGHRTVLPKQEDRPPREADPFVGCRYIAPAATAQRNEVTTGLSRSSQWCTTVAKLQASMPVHQMLARVSRRSERPVLAHERLVVDLALKRCNLSSRSN